MRIAGVYLRHTVDSCKQRDYEKCNDFFYEHNFFLLSFYFFVKF